MSVLTSNYTLQALGVIYQANVNSITSLDVILDDNGNGSTITFESAPDNATWTTMTTGVYQLIAGNPNLQATNGTTTSKGRYQVDLTGVTYFRARVSTYVSGNVLSRVEENASPLKGIITMLQTGLVAQGATQATALPLQAVYNQFATVAASTGAGLSPNVGRNSEQVVKNSGANAITVYPPVGYAINGGAVNAGVSVAAATSARFISDGTGNFWQF